MLMSSWVAKSFVVTTVVAMMGATIYFFVLPSGLFSSSGQDWLMSEFGLGLIPLALWIAAFVWALAFQRPLLQHVNLWLGSFALVLATVGLFGMFRSFEGSLAGFTLDIDVSLGGQVGKALVGDSWTEKIIRVGAFALAGIAAFFPSKAALPFVLVYLLLYMVARGFGHMIGLDHPAKDQPRVEPAVSTNGTSRYSLSANEGRSRFSEFARIGSTNGSTAGATENGSIRGPAQSRLEELIPAIGEARREREISDREVIDDPPAPESDYDEDSAEQDIEMGVNGELPPYVPSTVKFNRFWATEDSTDDDHVEESSENPGGDIDGDQRTISDPKSFDDLPMASSSASWTLPSYDLLVDAPEGGVTEEEINETSQMIQKTLAEYGVEVEIGQTQPGPTVTMYGLIPGYVRKYKQVRENDENGRPKLDENGKQIVTRVETKTRVKVDTILSREKDLALALKTPSIRIETPAMGQSLVGIEVPNPNPSLVTLRRVMEGEEFTSLKKKAHLPIALGKGSGGDTVVFDLAKMPHLLIAGATGSGKSVCINAIISCLIMEKSPEEMRLLLVDPKRVELTPYNGIPHLLAPVVVETDQVVGYLKGLIREMLDRYRRMEEVGVRNIEAYNRRMPDRMPFLVVAIDELADLMMTSAFDVEQSLCRLAQLGRATGIHLIVATQRPSVDVVTGLIKANFPSRISFGVTSQVDSRTILDTAGADKLLGRGDMLYLPLDASRPGRVQNVFIGDQEIEGLVQHWQNTPRGRITEILLNTVDDEQVDNNDSGAVVDMRDELLDKAIELAYSYNKMSTSLLQRRMRVGYPRAARLMDQLEDAGIVGPSDGSKSRDVIMSKV